MNGLRLAAVLGRSTPRHVTSRSSWGLIKHSLLAQRCRYEVTRRRFAASCSVDDHNDGAQDQRSWHQSLASALVHILRRAALAAAGLLVLAAAAVVPVPYVLSHPLGLKGALAVANAAASPACMRIEGLSAGWGRPLVLEGLTLSERPATARGMPPEQQLRQQQRIQFSAALGAGPLGVGAGASGEAVRVGLAQASSGPSASSPTPEALEAAPEPCHPGGRVLFSAERVRTAQPLWQVLWAQLPAAAQERGGSVDVLVSGPNVDCSLNEGGELQFISLLRKAGLIPAPPPLGPDAGLQQGVATPGPPIEGAGAAAPAVPEGAEGGQGQQGGAGSPVGLQSMPSSSNSGGGSSNGGYADNTTSGMAPAAGPAANQSSSRASDSGGPLGAAAASAVGPRLSLLPSFLQASSPVDFSGEVRNGRLHVYLSGGTLVVPQEIRELLGRHLHFEALQGASAIAEAAIDEALDAAAGGGDEVADAAKAGTAWAAQPLRGLPAAAGRPRAPFALHLDSDMVKLSARGWQTGRGYVYLEEPARASLEFTPALSRHLLARLNPLLGHVVSVRGQQSLQASVLPVGGVWPSEGLSLRVEGVNVLIEQSQMLKEALGVVRLGDSRLARGGALEAQLSPIEATVTIQDRVESRRLDLRLATGRGRAIHLASWGTAHLQEEGSVDMVLCLPGDTLWLLGLHDLDPEFGIPLRLTGTVREPRLLGVARATQQVGLLLLQQQVAGLEGRGLPVPARVQQELSEGLRRFGLGTQYRMPPAVQ